MPNWEDKLAANLNSVRQKMADAAQRSGRHLSDITLVAVTKSVSAGVARALVACGCGDLGESRPQELWAKAAALSDLDVRWHQIGHLQRNKLARTLPRIHLLHSADSRSLLEAIDRAAKQLDRKASILIEVNISGDAAKHGFRPAEVGDAIRVAGQLGNVRLLGLMTMAGLEGGVDRARRDFAALRALRDELASECPAGSSLAQLSMGMSGDFEVAIEEGATMVRIGSALFEGMEVADGG
jgi:hypothetical protein